MSPLFGWLAGARSEWTNARSLWVGTTRSSAKKGKLATRVSRHAHLAIIHKSSYSVLIFPIPRNSYAFQTGAINTETQNISRPQFQNFLSLSFSLEALKFLGNSKSKKKYHETMNERSNGRSVAKRSSSVGTSNR